LRLIISSQELLARRLTHLERSERASAIGRTVGSSGRRGALVKM
jgi:hypothetical protein